METTMEWMWRLLPDGARILGYLLKSDALHSGRKGSLLSFA